MVISSSASIKMCDTPVNVLFAEKTLVLEIEQLNVQERLQIPWSMSTGSWQYLSIDIDSEQIRVTVNSYSHILDLSVQDNTEADTSPASGVLYVGAASPSRWGTVVWRSCHGGPTLAHLRPVFSYKLRYIIGSGLVEMASRPTRGNISACCIHWGWGRGCKSYKYWHNEKT